MIGGALGTAVVPPKEKEKLAGSPAVDVPNLKGAFDGGAGVSGASASPFFSDSGLPVVVGASSFVSLGFPKGDPVGLGASA
jgi:hypothetical protein